ncbi:U2 small nuclear ribonucleoprotein auxiliary factor 35 kDa subunit-related protein 2-like isoform X1 [Neocloeon triangulifer]|uniref:U2 small nuclear ribonucleoprotein auxiliary factor 35 kDa subunit-related protein 2-like isoform X1 n=1 Tax=Neocloeon triangulifer TaxID=2078957 RepID=UPI00286EC53C|nr:U2 small nuclear ribonucleoprotein auxiliary factor 35 kDa subunit-related protein 2-like isoform X1 [Neocloeon triangulifer]
MGRHKEWRKEAKKQRRKKIRQKSAKERQKELLNAESNPCAQAWLKEQEDADEAIRTEEMLQSEKNNLKWMQEELRAQQEFKVKRLERKKQDEEIARQKAELLKEIQEREEKKRQKEQEEKERLEMQEEAIRLREQKIEDFLQKGCELPDEVRVSIESNPLQPTCPFFQKVAACRFNDACSRNHIRPSISCTVLIPSMFTHPSLVTPMGSQAGDQECSLEYTDTEIQNDYNEFFEDVCSEVEKLGRVIRFLTCCNFEPHLRGNVYVQLQNERDALRVCRNLSGRWFGGRRLQPLFVDISNWRNAVCGLFRYGRCPKGRSCNFLHIFVNPKRLFMNSPVRRASTASSSNSWSPERESSRASSSKSRRSHSRRSNRSRSRSPRRSSRSSRKRSRRRSPDENLKRKSRERSLSPWSPGRRLTTDTPPRKELSDSTNTP